jgi:putative Mn2+ efflux pump MntP
MSLLALFVLALGLSVDAFAAAVGRGAAVDHPHVGVALRSGLVFGLVEMITPVIGWALGVAFSSFVDAIDHWIAFVLLFAVGGHMAWHALAKGEAEEDAPKGNGSLLGLIATAIGTSIDAMAIGITLALLDVDIRVAAPIIGATTFVMASFGMWAGKMIGEKIGHRAEIVAGVGLALIGCIILYEHTLA